MRKNIINITNHRYTSFSLKRNGAVIAVIMNTLVSLVWLLAGCGDATGTPYPAATNTAAVVVTPVNTQESNSTQTLSAKIPPTSSVATLSVTPGVITSARSTVKEKGSATTRQNSEDASKEATRLAGDFLRAFQQGDSQSINYLGDELKRKITSGQTTLPLLLGVQNRPISVEVSLVSDEAVYIRQGLLYFQGGRNFVRLELEQQAAGLKITGVYPEGDTATPRSSAGQDAREAEAVITGFFESIDSQNYQAAFKVLSNRYRQEVNGPDEFAATYKGAIKSIKVTGSTQEDVVGIGENHLIYKIQLQVQVGQSPSNFNNGINVEWIKLVKPGQEWQIDQIASSPIQ